MKDTEASMKRARFETSHTKSNDTVCTEKQGDIEASDHNEKTHYTIKKREEDKRCNTTSNLHEMYIKSWMMN